MTGFIPCPQCNGHNIHNAEWYSDFSGETEYYGICDDCGYRDPDTFDEPSVAIDHWNRRVATGFLGGSDPTGTDYDKLEEDDWDVDEIDEPVGEISWGDNLSDIYKTDKFYGKDILNSKYDLSGLDEDYDEDDDKRYSFGRENSSWDDLLYDGNDYY